MHHHKMDENTSDNKVVCKTNCSCGATRKRSVCCSFFVLLLAIAACLMIVLCIKAVLLKEQFHRSILDANPQFLHSSNDSIFARAKRLGEAIKFKTISMNTKDDDGKRRAYHEALLQINAFIEQAYPNLHSSSYIKKVKVNNHSMIFRMQGDMSDNRTPYMLCGHLDVAAIYQKKRWDYDPFLGEIRTSSCYSDYCSFAEFDMEDCSEELFVYGRGAMDTKNVVFGVLEVLEHLVTHNIRPKRTLYIAFGHDEEIGGRAGAKYISYEMKRLLNIHNEKLEFILDEGSAVVKGVIPFVEHPLIYVGVTEKGRAKIKLEPMPNISGNLSGNSLRKARCLIGSIVSQAVETIRTNEQPSMFGLGPEFDTLQYIGAHVSNFGYKIILSNLWLFSGLIASVMGKSSKVSIVL